MDYNRSLFLIKEERKYNIFKKLSHLLVKSFDVLQFRITVEYLCITV